MNVPLNVNVNVNVRVNECQCFTEFKFEFTDRAAFPKSVIISICVQDKKLWTGEKPGFSPKWGRLPVCRKKPGFPPQSLFLSCTQNQDIYSKETKFFSKNLVSFSDRSYFFFGNNTETLPD